MIPKLRHIWQEMRASFWFVPAVLVLVAEGLATGLIALDANVELHVDKKWPLVFGASAAGFSRLLTPVASSMITVAGLVFSITIVALSLTSSQYTSRCSFSQHSGLFSASSRSAGCIGSAQRRRMLACGTN